MGVNEVLKFLIYESFWQYALFFPLDVWTKFALKKISTTEQQQHVWRSQAQILLILSVVVLVWRHVLPFLLLLLALGAYLSGNNLTLKEAVLHRLRHFSIWWWYGLSILSTYIVSTWFWCVFIIGDGVTYTYHRILGNIESSVLEGYLSALLIYIKHVIFFMVKKVSDFGKKIWASIVFWADIFHSSPWEEHLPPDEQPAPEITAKPSQNNALTDTKRLFGQAQCEVMQQKATSLTTQQLETTYKSPTNFEELSLCSESQKKYQLQNVDVMSKFVPMLDFARNLWIKTHDLFKHNFNQLPSRSQPSFKGTYPPGLRNRGQNLCFLNSVLQCFFRSPNLWPNLQFSLTDEVISAIHLSECDRTFLMAFRDLMLAVLIHSPTSQLQSQFCEAVSSLAPSLVNPSMSCQHQVQQDAAEFLMWLINKLHQTMSSKAQYPHFPSKISSVTPSLKEMKNGHSCNFSPSFQEKVWKQLCFSGIITHFTNKDLREIGQKTDLDWLIYKRQNSSPIDSQFVGQAAEFHQCLKCYKTSFTSQVYNILYLPLSFKFKNDTQRLTVPELLEAFTQVEELMESKDLRCTCEINSKETSQLTHSYKHSSPLTPCGLGFTPPFIQRTFKAKTSTPVNFPTRFASRVCSSIPYPTTSPLSSLLQSPILSTPSANQYFKLQSTQWLKRTLLCRSPPCLNIQLLRFQYDTAKGVPCKLTYPVKVPLFNMFVPVVNGSNSILDTSIKTHKSQEYELYGLVLHLGARSTAYGHYVAYAREHDTTGKPVWFRFDDEVVTEVKNMSMELDRREVQENVYLLFYKQCSI
ncbi:uncharacterized protein LOC143226453 [Tachypleus tridentatus]|uniref:uncharacterized protein LOC143226453 n=1 Tax=Tachypleus tridentatus TaxID=6853 RepID=UPI003FD47748